MAIRIQTYQYFTYGSNLFTRRLQKRTPSAAFIAVGRLRGYDLRFHKKSQDNKSGKCDACEMDDPSRLIWGVVYEIAAGEIPKLNIAEGLGHGYEKKTVQVECEGGTVIDAFTYYVADGQYIDSDRKPFAWYKEYVVKGAIEHNLPSEYVDAIRAEPDCQDPDEDRRSCHEQFLVDSLDP